jgi:cell division protein FtsL
MSQDTQPGELPRISKVIDFRLPLTWLLGVAFMVAGSFVTMYFQIGQLREDMTDLKITVKAGNNQASTVQGELAILRFRIETLESDKRKQ